MAVAETAKLVVDLSLKGNFARQLSTTSRALNRFDARLSDTEGRAFRAGQQIGTGIKRAGVIAASGIGILASQVAFGLQSLVELEQQQAQTNAVIKSTKGIAGVTADEVGRLSEKYESLNATISDEVIRSGENLLLTFTNIRKKAFEPTLQAALDMNTALGKGPEGLTSTIRIVGRALNDPTKGMTALTRAGVQFTDAEVKKIKALQKSGRLYEAQTIILGKLETKFGGSFIAQGDTTAGKVAKFGDAVEDLQRTLAAGLLPVVSNIADALSDLFQDPAVQQGVREFGENLAKVFSPGAIRSGIATIKDVFSTIASVAGPAASAVGTMVAAFNRLPPDLRNLLIGAFAVNKLTGGLVTNVAGGLAGAIGGALKTIVAGNVTVIGRNVTGGGLPTPGGAPKPGGGGALSKAGGLLKIAGSVTVAGIVAGAAATIAGVTRESDNRIINSQGNITRQVANTNQRLAISNTALAALRARAVAGDAFAARQLAQMRDQATKIEAVRAMSQRTKDDTVRATNQTKQTLSAKLAETRRETSRGVMATRAVRAAEVSGASRIVGATQSQTSAIVGALYATRVTVQSVTKNTTIVQRYGPSNGSSGRFGQ